MPRLSRPLAEQTNLPTEKENNLFTGTGPQRQPSGRQRQPTEKITTTRAEEAAAAERREAAKERKFERARRALDNSEDEREDNQGDDLVASTTFKTHTVASKPVFVKTKALATGNRVSKAASFRPVSDDDEDLPVLPKRVAKAGRVKPARVREETPAEDEPADNEDIPDEEDDKQDEEENRDLSPELEPVPRRLSRGQSRTPSTGAVLSLKRRQSSSDSLKETKIRKTSGGRPKAADYDDFSKALIVSAISYYRANLSSASAFPDMAMEAEMLAQVWNYTCTELETTATITPQIAKLVKSSLNTSPTVSIFDIYWQITSRGSQLRGELKSKTRPLVEACFGFESGLNRKIIAKNRETAENLKDGKGFVYKEPDADATKRKGMYQAKIIQKVVNVMWFRNKQDEGVIHEIFNPLTIEALALVLAAMECCIDEWISGIRTDIPFSTALYKDVYEDHIRCLERFNKLTKQMILPNILVKLYNRGRFHAGALPISTVSAPTISDSAFIAALKEYEDADLTESDGENGDSD